MAQALTKDQQKWGVSFGGGAATPFGGLQAGGTVSSKGWEVIVPIAVEVVRTIAENQQKLGVSFSGGASTPLGGFQGGGAVSFKGWESVVPIAIEIARTLSKGEQQQKLIGIDDAILIPAIASIASALINKI